MIFPNTYFVEDLLKAASQTISFQQAKSKYVCPKVRNFERSYFWLLLDACLEPSRAVNYRLAVNYFCKRSSIVDIRQVSKFTSDCIHPSWLFLGDNDTNLLILVDARINRCPKYSTKNLNLTVFNRFWVFYPRILCIAHYLLFSISFHLLILKY